MTRVAVIGAGAAGLATARRLRASGVNTVVYEAGSRPGGLWVYENDNGLSPAYRSLHVNSEAAVTAFPGFPFPSGTPLYPDHNRMADYFASFVDSYGLADLIRFRTPVKSVTRADGGWVVTDASDGEEIYSHVVVATGHQNEPRHASFVKDFTGIYLHSHAYRTPDEFADQEVLVVGAGNSALDIAADICTVARSTTLAARSPVQILPRMFLGVPTSRVLARIEKPWLPWPVSRAARNLICRVAHGPMEQWGFRTPRTRTHPTSHPTVVHHMTWNRIIGKPGVDSVRDDVITFADGSERRFDVVIGATGYEVTIPVVGQRDNPVSGHDVDLYRRIVHPGSPGLFFVGFFNVSGGANIAMMDHQATWVAGVVSGDVDLPPVHAMHRSIRDDQRHVQARYPGTPRYGLELEPHRYLQQLADDNTRTKRVRP